jgi:hypothetical protein
MEFQRNNQHRTEVGIVKKVSVLLVIAALAMVGLMAGCEHGSSGGSNDAIGTWQVTTSEGTMYLVFNADGTFDIEGTPGGAPGATGTYSISGDTITSTWASSVKTGEVDGTISGTSITGTFSEDQPPKSLSFTGTKQ